MNRLGERAGGQNESIFVTDEVIRRYDLFFDPQMFDELNCRAGLTAEQAAALNIKITHRRLDGSGAEYDSAPGWIRRTYGEFMAGAGNQLLCSIPSIKLSLPAIERATEEPISLSAMRYSPGISLSHNLSAVLVHELFHYKEYLDRKEQPKLAASRNGAVNRARKEEEARVVQKTRSLFADCPPLGQIIIAKALAEVN
jgi:hypothetical protein